MNVATIARAAAERMAREPQALDHAAWCREHLPRIFDLPFGPHHGWILSRLGQRPSGVRAFAGAPRGSGKTATALVGLPISCMAQGTHRFIAIAAQEQGAAEARLRAIRSEIQRNMSMAARHPRLRFVQARGRQAVDRAKEIQLEGGRIVAFGSGSSPRGLVRETPSGDLLRPDLVLFDDLDTAEQARSQLRTDRLEEWLFADVAGLQGPGGSPMDILGVGTTIDVDALASRALAGRGRFESWQRARFPAEYQDDDGVRRASWSEGQPLDKLDRLLDPQDQQFVGAYTYAKEYLLDPRRREGTTFARATWGMVREAPEGLRVVRRWDLAATADTGTNDPDWTAGVKLGVDGHGRFFVLDLVHFRGSPGEVEMRIRQTAERDGADVRIGIEQEPGASGKSMVAYYQRALAGYVVSAERASGPKTTRAEGIAAQAEHGNVFVVESGWNNAFFRDVEDFPNGAHDDVTDALSGAFEMLTGVARPRSGVRLLA